MNLARISCLTGAVLMFSAVVSSQANAQINAFGNNIVSQMGNGTNLAQVRGGIAFPPYNYHELYRTIPRPFGNSILPYFSLYPPVYYSHSVPRPYGYSPFALPPGMQPAEALAGPVNNSEEIINPYVKPDATEPAEATGDGQVKADAISTSKLIVNPYVKQRNGQRQDKLASLPVMITN